MDRTKIKRAALAAGILVGAAVMGWLWYRSTPGYALGRIKRAIVRRDVASFRKYVDLDAVLSRAMTALAGPGGAEADASGGFSLVAGPFLTAQAKAMIEAWVAGGNWPEAGDSAGAGLARIRDFQYRGASRREGGRIALQFHHAKYDRGLEVVLRFEPAGGGREKLTEIANLAELVAEMTKAEAEWRDKQNQPILDQIAVALKTEPIEKRTSGGFWVSDRRYHLWLPVKNTSGQTITALEGRFEVRVPPPEGRTKIIAARFDPIDLAPGAEQTMAVTLEVSPLDPADQAIFSTPFDQLDLSFIPSRLTFSDGSSLAVPYP